MNHLHRELAPITEGAWSEIDAEAKLRLTTFLAARRLVDFAGPRGWEVSAVSLGRTEPVSGEPPAGIEACTRRVLPLVEYRAPFRLALSELAAFDRGAADMDLDPLVEAAKRIALAENAAVFHGFGAGGITGITEASRHEAIALSTDCQTYPRQVARGVRRLLSAGVGGPFALALSSDLWLTVVETTEHGGYPLLEHLREALDDGPIVLAPGIEGGVVLSQRGGDFRFESGQDLSVGYAGHDGEQVTLYLEESFTFRVSTPEAAVVLAPE